MRIMSGVILMKYLRIEASKAQYCLDGRTWTDIEQLSRDDLLSLIQHAAKDDFEMDIYDEKKLPNQAQQIVYRNISERLAELTKNRTRFLDESEALFRDSFERYSRPSI